MAIFIWWRLRTGKTTLGIEFIRRNRPALILVPTVTIRQQWVDRIREAFLDDASLADEMISQNLKQPKTITVATYQALHSAINRLEGDAEVEDTDDVVENEHFDLKTCGYRCTLQECVSWNIMPR